MANMKAPEKIYFGTQQNTINPFSGLTQKCADTDVEYIRTDAFIDKACDWIKGNITNNPNANSVLVRNGCVTLTMLIEDFKTYMKGE